MKFTSNGDLVIAEIPRYSKHMIPVNIVEEIFWALEDGKDYTEAHTHFKITKEQADFIQRNCYPRTSRPK